MSDGAFIVVDLAGPPRGKGRPRFGKMGNFVRVWTDKKTVNYEELLADEGRIQMQGRPARLGPLAVQIDAAMPIPASWSRTKRASAISGELCHTSKPDFDNISKIVGDSLNKIVWHDDSQIIRCVFTKFYSEEPGLRVACWEWD